MTHPVLHRSNAGDPALKQHHGNWAEPAQATALALVYLGWPLPLSQGAQGPGVDARGRPSTAGRRGCRPRPVQGPSRGPACPLEVAWPPPNTHSHRVRFYCLRVSRTSDRPRPNNLRCLTSG